MQGFKPCFVDLFLLLQVYLFSRGSYLYIIYGLVDRFPHDVLMYWLHYALQTYIIHLLIHTYRTRPATTTSLLVQYNRKGRCNKRKQKNGKRRSRSAGGTNLLSRLSLTTMTLREIKIIGIPYVLGGVQVRIWSEVVRWFAAWLDTKHIDATTVFLSYKDINRM